MDIPFPKPWELHPMLVHFPIAFLLGAVLLMFTGHVGGTIVLRHGAGVDPKILAPEIRGGNSHQNRHSNSSESGDEYHNGDLGGHGHD